MERGYGQYCPVALAAEVLAERWMPLIIRNLLLDCHRFSEIHEGCPRLSTVTVACTSGGAPNHLHNSPAATAAPTLATMPTTDCSEKREAPGSVVMPFLPQCPDEYD
jgi:hypothetical protein